VAAALATLPDQIEAARSEALSAVLPDVVPTGLAIVGMGGSGIAGDVLAALAGPLSVVPVVTVKGYQLPAFVSLGWLVLSVSYSGETEEVIVATQAALDREATVAAVTLGGTLEALVGGAGGTVIAVAADVPLPRLAFAALVVPGLVLADRLGLVPEDAFDLAAAAAQARRRRDQCRPDAPAGANPARALAERIGRAIPVFHGGGAVGAVAAYRAKCDVNENAKVLAFAHSHPELCHNEVCGWGAAGHGHVLVDLRTGLEHPQVRRRQDIVAEMAAEAGRPVLRVDAEGEGSLARLVDLVSLTQWASLYLAAEREVDPGPIDAITTLKARLG
jgi:glucose/mannose-6-phosphate isomerase